MKRIFSLLLSLLILITCLFGFGACSDDEKAESPKPPATQAPVKSSDKPAEVSSPEDSMFFPLEEKVEFSAWAEWVFDQLPTVFTDWNDSIAYQLLEKATNVHINFQTPSFRSENEQFQLLMASQEYPDIIANFTTYYSAGIPNAVENQIAIIVDEYVEKYMPNYRQVLEDPDIKRAVTTDEGYMAALYMMNNVKQAPWNGMGIRKDFLDRLGLEIPETYDELHDVLKAFKDELGLKAPMNLDGFGAMVGDHISWLFAPGYGVIGTVYAENGTTAKYGPVQPAYRDYIEMLRNWYAEGLIDPDFESNNPLFGEGETMLINDQVGYTIACDFVGTWEENNRIPINPDFYLYPTPCMTLNKGEHTHFGVFQNIIEVGSVITTSADNLETLFRWIDYCYGDEAFLMMNFGEEGTTFYFDENGEPTLNVEWCESYFNTEFPNVHRGLVCIRMPYRRDLYKARDNHKNNGVPRETYWLSGEVWAKDDGTWLWPATASLTAEESAEYSAIYNDINTLFVETATKVIKGADMSEWDKAVETAKRMGVDRMVEIRQASLNRYNNRT